MSPADLLLADGRALADGLAWVFVALGLGTLVALGLIVSTLRLSFGGRDLPAPERSRALRRRALANYALALACLVGWLLLGGPIDGDEAKLLLGLAGFALLGGLATRRAVESSGVAPGSEPGTKVP